VEEELLSPPASLLPASLLWEELWLLLLLDWLEELDCPPLSLPHAAMPRTMTEASALAITLFATFFFIFYLRLKN